MGSYTTGLVLGSAVKHNIEIDQRDEDEDFEVDSMPVSSPYKELNIHFEKERRSAVEENAGSPNKKIPNTPIVTSRRFSSVTPVIHKHTLEPNHYNDTPDRVIGPEQEAELVNGFVRISEQTEKLAKAHNSLSNFNESFASFIYGFNINAWCCAFNQTAVAKTKVQRDDIMSKKKEELEESSMELEEVTAKLIKLSRQVSKIRSQKTQKTHRLQSTLLGNRRAISNINDRTPGRSASLLRTPSVNRRQTGFLQTPTTPASGVSKHTNFLRSSGKTAQLKRIRELESKTPVSSRPGSTSSNNLSMMSNESSVFVPHIPEVRRATQFQTPRITRVERKNTGFKSARANTRQGSTEDTWSIKGRKPFR